MPPKTKDARAGISDILKKHAASGTRAGTLDEITDEVQGLPTGNLAIDYGTGVGGFPVGRIVEAFGPPSCGKTTVALQCAGALQKDIIESGRDEYILYVDFEHALDKIYAESLGLDLSHESVLVTQPEFLEDGAQLVRDLIDTGKVKLIIWDSVAEALPKAVKEAETGQSQIAIRAKIMSQFLQQINGALFRHDCTMIFINHIQEKISVSGYTRVVTKTTPGGDALKFYASLRLEFTSLNKQKGKRFSALTNTEEEYTISGDTKVTFVKNKVGPPQRNCVLRVRYGKGFDNFWSAVQVLIGHRLITLSAGSYYFDRTPGLVVEGLPQVGGRPGVRGEDNLLRYADSNSEWRQIIINAAVKVVQGSSGTDMMFDIDDTTEDLIPGLSSFQGES